MLSIGKSKTKKSIIQDEMHDFQRYYNFEQLAGNVSEFQNKFRTLNPDQRNSLLLFKADGGRTLFHYVCEKNFLETAFFLLSQEGALICPLQDDHGNTALHLLCRAVPSPVTAPLQDQLCSLMCKRGAYIPNKSFETPLHVACMYSNLDAVKTFVETMQQDVNVVTRQGDTPLHLSVYQNNPVIAKVLLGAGAVTNIKNSKGLSPIDLATQLKVQNMIDLFSTPLSSAADTIIFGRPSAKVPLDHIEGLWEVFRTEFFNSPLVYYYFNHDGMAVAAVQPSNGKGLLISASEAEFLRFTIAISEDPETLETAAEICAKLGETLLYPGKWVHFEADANVSLLSLEAKLEQPKRICIGVLVEHISWLEAFLSVLPATKCSCDNFVGWKGFHVSHGVVAYYVPWQMNFEFVFHLGNAERDAVILRFQDEAPTGNSATFASIHNMICLTISGSGDQGLSLNCFYRGAVDGFSPVLPKTALPAADLLDYICVNAINGSYRTLHSRVNRRNRERLYNLTLADFISTISKPTAAPGRPHKSWNELRVGYLNRKKYDKNGQAKTETFFIVLRIDGLSFYMNEKREERIGFIPFQTLKKIDQKNLSTVVLTDVNGKMCELMSIDGSDMKPWHSALSQNRPVVAAPAAATATTTTPSSPPAQQVASPVVAPECIIEGFLSGGFGKTAKKPYYYRLRRDGTMVYSKKFTPDSRELGNLMVIGMQVSLNAERALILKNGLDGTIVFRNFGASATTEAWLEAIKKVQADVAKVAEAKAMENARHVDRVPEFFGVAIQVILNRGLKEKGIFRLSAEKDDVESLALAWFRGTKIFQVDHIDIHVIAGALKKYLRDLMPIPLLTFELYDSFFSCSALDVRKRVPALWALMYTKLPAGFLKMLGMLLDLLNAIHNERGTNLMGSRNLAIVFAPSLLRSRHESPMSLVQDMNGITSLTAFMVKHYYCCHLHSSNASEAVWSHPEGYDDDVDDVNEVAARDKMKESHRKELQASMKSSSKGNIIIGTGFLSPQQSSKNLRAASPDIKDQDGPPAVDRSTKAPPRTPELRKRNTPAELKRTLSDTNLKNAAAETPSVVAAAAPTGPGLAKSGGLSRRAPPPVPPVNLVPAEQQQQQQPQQYQPPKSPKPAGGVSVMLSVNGVQLRKSGQDKSPREEPKVSGLSKSSGRVESATPPPVPDRERK